MRRCLILLGVVCLVGAVAPAAQASVVTSSRAFYPFTDLGNTKTGPESLPERTVYALSFAAGPGEANAVSFEPTPSGFVVRDAAGLTAGDGCAQTDATTAICATPPQPGTAAVERGVVRASLGDGDDTITLPTEALPVREPEVDGGSGDDTIIGAGKATGGEGNDRIDAVSADGGAGEDVIVARQGDGGEGNDTLGPRPGDAEVTFRGGGGDDVITGSDALSPGDLLDGGPGNDRLAGGGGDDRLVPGPGADVLDGGPGVDLASFADATGPVRADLAALGPILPTDEGDVMSAVESVEGGRGDDVLLGTDGPSILMGGDGDDRLDGRGGADILIGGRGADTIGGGAGADELSAGPAIISRTRRSIDASKPDDAADRLAGGAGPDTVTIDRGDHADGGAGDDLVVARGRPASARCGTGTRDRFDGLRLPRDCERIVWFDVTSAPARLSLRGDHLRIRVPGYFGGPVTVTVRVDGRRVASGTSRIAFDRSRRVRLPVDRRGRRALRGARSVRVEVRAPGPESRRERDVAVLPAPR